MRKIIYVMIVVLFAVLLPKHAVQAAEQEAVILTAEQGMAAVQIEIPDPSQGVSTLRLRVTVEGDIGYVDSTEPILFELNEEVKATLLETRYNAEQGYVTIYISDPDKITDRSSFILGYLLPNTTGSSSGSLTISVQEDGLEYVDGTGQLNDEIKVSPSEVMLDTNASSGKPEENPGNSDDELTEESGGEADSGSEDGAAGGTTGGETTGSVSESNENTATDHTQSNDSNNGEVVTAVQTGDHTRLMMVYGMTVLSALTVIVVMLVLRLRNRSDK